MSGTTWVIATCSPRPRGNMSAVSDSVLEALARALEHGGHRGPQA